MRLSRRLFLQMAGIGSLLTASGLWVSKYVWAIDPLSDAELKTLRLFIDQLIPSDDTPGALALGLDKPIIAQVGNSRSTLRFIKRACQMINESSRSLSGKDFVTASAANRFDVVEAAASAESDAIMKRFFVYIRGLTMTEYYAQSENWQALDYSGPPQPSGFTDYRDPPTDPSAHG